VLYEVLDATIELQGADFGNIQLYDKETRTLEIVAQRGFQQDFLDYFARVDAYEGSACGLALKQRSRVIIEDVNLNADLNGTGISPHWQGFARYNRRRLSTVAAAGQSACCPHIFATRTNLPFASCD
jgi:hypothetical protein